MTDIHQLLTKYLTDAHAIEEQALIQMKVAPKIAGHPRLEEIFRRHETETAKHEQLIRQRLEDRGAQPSRVKDAVMKAGGMAFALFPKTQPDTAGKLVAHAFSYEHMELAGYDLLIRVAERAGDAPTVVVARRIRAEEREMSERLEASFDEAVEASLRDVPRDDLGAQLDKYLGDAHALEAQAIQLLQKGAKIAGHPQLESVYAEHLEESRAHQRLVAERLAARGASPNAAKDAAMRLGALNWGMFFAAQPDTPGKLAAFSYAFEHLEIGGYEQLRRVAERAGDRETVAAAQRILGEERAAAKRVSAGFDAAVDATLRVQGVTTAAV
jgi:ferritin-like metal-binding protein YciE